MDKFMNSKHAIETVGLTKYYGTNIGIKKVNLNIKTGEIFGFIGPNGAGKSTTIRTLLGLIFPTSGSAKIFGLDIIKDSKEIKKHIGFMPSEINYYHNMNGRQLLKYSSAIYNIKCRDRIKELAEVFNLNLNRKIIDLSLGNKKKISILQSVIHNPKLLILDEPTSGLDPLMQARFFELLKELNEKGVTIFFSSHTLSEVQRLCKRVAIIRDGEIIKVEEVDTLRKKQLKKIRISEDSISEKILELEDISIIDRLNGFVSFLYNGDIKKLLSMLIKGDVGNLTIEEPDLEDVFMHYYTEKKGTENE